MDARTHYSRPLLLQLQGSPAVSPAPGPATGGTVPDAFLNANAILLLSLLVCGLVAALALRVALQCALRVTRGDGRDRADGDAEHGTARDDAGQAAPSHGGAKQQQQQRRPRRLTKLVQALPCLAYSSALELAGSSRSECAICLAPFARGEAVRVLPRCSHGFHARCIDRWLAARPTCPTCRQAPFTQTTALLQPDSSAGLAAVPLVRVVIVGDRVARLVEP
ncbi:unnamed protein product [Urochloa decumbens]|uniref:RING-type domain-containing protein n=1 Tax=Urochloa decumbens TaxID=240449 RepID=A0ABC8VN91_9POAL